MTSHIRTRELSPHRSLRWRWDRANEIVHDDTKLRRSDDAIIRLAAKYQRFRLEADVPVDEYSLPDRLRDIHFASLAEVVDNSPEPRMQLMLLGRAPTAAISTLMGADVEIVELYRDLFFDIAAPRDDRSWMMRHAVGWEHARPGDLRTIMRTIAYVRGYAFAEIVSGYLVVDPGDWDRVGSRVTQIRELDQGLRDLATASMAATSAADIEHALAVLTITASAIQEKRCGGASLCLLERNAPQIGSPPARNSTLEHEERQGDGRPQRTAGVI
jgi:hypothetical protein